jgi:hypothetical protein
MLTHLLTLLLIVYAIAALAALFTMVLLGDLPEYFDRATTYGDEKLNWRERVMLIVFLPSILIYVYWHDKWPGLKGILVELWATIVLGRQVKPKDTMKGEPGPVHWEDQL